MNPLEALKQKLRVKPVVEEKERVAVVIKGEQKKITEPKKRVAREKVDEELEEFVPEVEGDKDIVKAPVTAVKGPIIVDETDRGFDRATLMDKLKASKLLKVSVKPLIEEVEESKSVEPVLPKVIKRAKKVKLPLIIEGEEGEEEVPQKKRLIIEGEQGEVEEEEIQQFVPVEKPKKIGRQTKKVEKGIAVLGAETVVDL